jgi:hypothetical protein
MRLNAMKASQAIGRVDACQMNMNWVAYWTSDRLTSLSHVQAK